MKLVAVASRNIFTRLPQGWFRWRSYATTSANYGGANQQRHVTLRYFKEVIQCFLGRLYSTSQHFGSNRASMDRQVAFLFFVSTPRNYGNSTLVRVMFTMYEKSVDEAINWAQMEPRSVLGP